MAVLCRVFGFGEVLQKLVQVYFRISKATQSHSQWESLILAQCTSCKTIQAERRNQAAGKLLLLAKSPCTDLRWRKNMILRVGKVCFVHSRNKKDMNVMIKQFNHHPKTQAVGFHATVSECVTLDAGDLRVQLYSGDSRAGKQAGGGSRGVCACACVCRGVGGHIPGESSMITKPSGTKTSGGLQEKVTTCWMVCSGISELECITL